MSQLDQLLFIIMGSGSLFFIGCSDQIDPHYLPQYRTYDSNSVALLLHFCNLLRSWKLCLLFQSLFSAVSMGGQSRGLFHCCTNQCRLDYWNSSHYTCSHSSTRFKEWLASSRSWTCQVGPFMNFFLPFNYYYYLSRLGMDVSYFNLNFTRSTSTLY